MTIKSPFLFPCLINRRYFSYLSDGTKISATNNIDEGLVYLGSLVYTKRRGKLELESAPLGEGRWIMTSAGPETRYFIKDHLGSVRAVFNEEGIATEQNNYYPFGAKWHASSIYSDNRYRYNGKEEQEFLNLPFSDYGARMYDPKTGRWVTSDPLCEKYFGLSPYCFCINNPLNHFDPDGKDIFSVNKKGHLTFVKSTSENFDTIITEGTDLSNVNDSNSVRVDKDILNNQKLHFEYDIGPKLGVSMWTETVFKNSESLTKTFEFMSKNTDVEWSKIEAIDQQDKKNFVLTTSHEKHHEKGAHKWIKNSKPKKVENHTHNHPNGSSPSEKDIETANKNPDTEFYLYRKKRNENNYHYEEY